MFVLSKKWCWSLLVLFVALIAFPYFIITYNWANDVIRNKNPELDRSFWGGLPAKPGLEPLNLPIVRIVVTQTYEHIIRYNLETEIDERGRCLTEDECSRRIRQLQIHYMKDLPDIPFNFLVGDDGNIYDGRGFLYQGDIPRSNRSHIQLNFGLVIAFIGDYSEEPPSTNQTEFFFRFLDSSAERDMIDDNFALWLDEDSPAVALNETLSESPHFGSGIYDDTTSRKPRETTLDPYPGNTIEDTTVTEPETTFPSEEPPTEDPSDERTTEGLAPV